MKVMNKTIEYYVIKVEDNRNFYIKVGNYINEEFYRLKEIEERYGKRDELFLNIDGKEIEAKEGHYILVNNDTGKIKYITKEEYENEYVELRETE